MKKFVPSAISQSRYTKWLLAAFVTIFLGAVGSGLWDRVLGPFFDFLSQASVTLISSGFHGYLDIVYGRVSKNPADQIIVLPYVFIVVTVVIFPWAFVILGLSSTKQIQQELNSLDSDSKEELTKEILLEKIRRKRRIITRFFIPFAILITIFYSEQLFQDMYSRKSALFLERSIEIVAPYIGERERLELRAHFRSIENASDFYVLESKLRALARQHNIKLPEFEAVR